MIAIVDTGGANHASVQDALSRLGEESRITLDPKVLAQSSRLILPGVGHAGFAMEKIGRHGLKDILIGYQKPVLGICLGMQLLFESSEEGDVPCLGIVPGRVRKLEATPDFRVPHMGWNQVRKTKASRLLEGLGSETYFYYVHSFYAPVCDYTVGRTNEFTAVVERDNFLGTQFHPERSSDGGAKLLRNFLKLGTT